MAAAKAAMSLFGAVDERADDHVLAVVGDELGRHRLELTREEEIEQQRHEHVVAVVAERDLGAAELGREAVEDAAAQARAERAVRLPLGDLLGDDGVRVLLHHAEVVPALCMYSVEQVPRVPGVALVDVDRR